jgi:tRNA nucleotidyltransferase (CCA-adding enzyme)
VKPALILEDLRRRDFTANAMAISLNEGSLGLLMDPLNGVADLENRELRLVSNYGFIDEPSRLIRAVRFQARTGWQLEERTRQRYENAKTEGYISALGKEAKAYELEEIFHEEDPLRIIRRLEAEGWMVTLSSTLTSAKASEAELERLRDLIGQLDQVGIHPDPSAAYFPLVAAKLSSKDQAALRASFARPGYSEQIAALEPAAKAFAAELTSKAAAAPSDAWKLIHAAEPEAVLWLAFSTKSAPIKAKFDAFFKDWSQARQKVPYQLMLEMRITPDLPGYDELVEKLWFAIMDGKLDTPEAMRAFLEPYSPPAPPPPVALRRRPVKRETKTSKSKAAKAVAPEAALAAEVVAELAAEPAPPAKPVAVKAASKVAAPAKPAAAAEKAPEKPKAPAKAPAKVVAPAKPAVKKPEPKAAAKPAKAAPKPAVKKPAAKPVKVVAVKAKAAKPVAKKVVAKSAKPAAKKPAPKPVKKVSPAKKVVAKKAPAKKPVVAKKVAKPVKKAKR